MKILFTASDKWGSKLIRWVTGGTSSHVAILLDDGIVVHSTLSDGVHLNWYENFLNHNYVVDSLDIVAGPGFLERLRAIEGRGYDWGLFFTMGLRRLGLPISEQDNPRLDLCTEVVAEAVLGKNNYNPSPAELLAELKELSK